MDIMQVSLLQHPSPHTLNYWNSKPHIWSSFFFWSVLKRRSFKLVDGVPDELRAHLVALGDLVALHH